MTHEDITVNNDENEFDDISIDQSDEMFKYTIVPNALIRDSSISPDCRWLIIYLMSNKKEWKINTRQLWMHTQGFIGRDGIRKILNEAIAAGYIQRNVILKQTHKGKLRGYTYVVASTPKFKKVLREPGFQAPEDQAPENQGTKELLSQELLYLSNSSSSLKVPEKAPKAQAAKAAEVEKVSSKKVKREKPDFSPKVREVGQQLINSLTRTKPDYLPPKNLSAFLTEVDFLLRIDKRDPQKIYDVFNWALADSFWADKMFKPNPAKYLREKFDQLEMKMNAKPAPKDRRFAPSSNDAESLKKVEEWEKGAL